MRAESKRQEVEKACRRSTAGCGKPGVGRCPHLIRRRVPNPMEGSLVEARFGPGIVTRWLDRLDFGPGVTAFESCVVDFGRLRCRRFGSCPLQVHGFGSYSERETKGMRGRVSCFTAAGSTQMANPAQGGTTRGASAPREVSSPWREHRTNAVLVVRVRYSGVPSTR
jgi:hypothetical protein